MAPASVAEASAAHYTMDDVAQHDSADSCWLVISGVVYEYDVTEFRGIHPGGASMMDAVAGKDATDFFVELHKPAVLEEIASEYASSHDNKWLDWVFPSHLRLTHPILQGLAIFRRPLLPPVAVGLLEARVRPLLQVVVFSQEAQRPVVGIATPAHAKPQREKHLCWWVLTRVLTPTP